MTFTNPIGSDILIKKYNNVHVFLNEWIDMRL